MNEIKFFSKKHYRTFFITRNFSKEGIYEFVINRDGRWVNEIVDDYIPIYEKTKEPIWGLDVNESWKIILIKLFAKIRGGYDKILHEAKPFDFIEVFSNTTWKFFHIGNDTLNFFD